MSAELWDSTRSAITQSHTCTHTLTLLFAAVFSHTIQPQGSDIFISSSSEGSVHTELRSRFIQITAHSRQQPSQPLNMALCADRIFSTTGGGFSMCVCVCVLGGCGGTAGCLFQPDNAGFVCVGLQPAGIRSITVGQESRADSWCTNAAVPTPSPTSPTTPVLLLLDCSMTSMKLQWNQSGSSSTSLASAFGLMEAETFSC